MIIEELKIIIVLIILSIFFLSFLDFISRIKDTLIKNKIWYLLLDLIFIIINVLVTINISNNLANGYIPSLFFIFIVIGVIIYVLLIKMRWLKRINFFLNIVNNNKKIVVNNIRKMIYSKTLLTLFVKEFGRYKRIFKSKKSNK